MTTFSTKQREVTKVFVLRNQFVFGIIPTVERTPNAQLVAAVDSTNLDLKHIEGDPVDLSDCIVRVKGAEVTNRL